MLWGCRYQYWYPWWTRANCVRNLSRTWKRKGFGSYAGDTESRRVVRVSQAHRRFFLVLCCLGGFLKLINLNMYCVNWWHFTAYIQNYKDHQNDEANAENHSIYLNLPFRPKYIANPKDIVWKPIPELSTGT